VLTPEQARRVLDAARDHRFEVIFHMALRTGLRRGELLALRWRDVDADTGILRVTGTLQPVPQGAEPIVAEPKSRSSRRSISVDTSLAAMLRQHKRLQAAHQAAAGAEWFDGDFIFTNDLGRPIAPMTLLRDWYLLLESIGLPRVPFHTARHTAATLMLSSGVSPRVAAERLGHSTVSITLDRYSHVTESLRRDAAMAIDRALREAGYRPVADRGSDRGSKPPERHVEDADSSVGEGSHDANGREDGTRTQRTSGDASPTWSGRSGHDWASSRCRRSDLALIRPRRRLLSGSASGQRGLPEGPRLSTRRADTLLMCGSAKTSATRGAVERIAPRKSHPVRSGETRASPFHPCAAQ
jgi:hypothetical protein